MKIWLGHYYENPKEWYLVWATDKQVARDKVDELGSPETGSMRELENPGIVNFCSQSGEDGNIVYLPSKVTDRNKNWLVLEGAITAETSTDYIRRLMGGKEANARFDMKVWFGNYLSEQEKSKKPREGFIVWAKTRQEALGYVERKIGNVDPCSLTECKKQGTVTIHPANKKGQLFCEPPKNDVKENTWISLGYC